MRDRDDDDQLPQREAYNLGYERGERAAAARLLAFIEHTPGVMPRAIRALRDSFFNDLRHKDVRP